MIELLPLLIDTWNFFRRHFVALCAVVLPMLVPLSVFYSFMVHYFSNDRWIVGLALIPGTLLYPIYHAALIFYITSVVSGQNLPTKQCYQRALRFWFPLMVLNIASGLAGIIGLALLFFPVLIVMARLAFSEFYCVLYEQKPMAAFKSSWKNTKDYQWQIMFGQVAILFATIIPVWLFRIVISVLDAGNPLVTFLVAVVSSILAIPTTIFGFRVFTLHQEKLNKESPGAYKKAIILENTSQGLFNMDSQKPTIFFMAIISTVSLGLITLVALYIVPVFSTTFENFDMKLSNTTVLVQATYKYWGVLLLAPLYVAIDVYKKGDVSKSYAKVVGGVCVVSFFVALMLLYLLMGSMYQPLVSAK